MVKKQNVGVVDKLYRNYGFIKTPKGEIFPFEFTSEMIVTDYNGRQFIKYSKDVKFEKCRVNLRGKDIYVATNIVFTDNLNYIARKNSNPYLEKVRDKFAEYNVVLPTNGQMKEEYKTRSDEQFIEVALEKFHHDISITDEDILYEWLKFKGFQPYMLDYLIDGVLNNHSIQVTDQLRINVADIVNMDIIDKRFRSQLLELILGVENSYKSLVSRISTQREGGIEIAAKLLDYWSGSGDGVKQKQYKRAKDRYKFLPYSDRYDYVLGSPSVTIDDLMDQLDLSNLENLLKKFNDFMQEKLSDGSIFFSPWIFNIARYSTLLRNLNLIRNASAHDRPIIPLIMNKEQNPNYLLELGESINTGTIEGWELFTVCNKVLCQKLNYAPKESIVYLNEVYGNIYRRAWFELNIIYNHFIALFDTKAYENYNRIIDNVNEILRNLNSINTKLSSISETLLNDYKFSEDVSKELTTKLFTEDIHLFVEKARGKN